MRPLQGEILLKAWERCSQQPGPARALTLLQASQPEWKAEDLAELLRGQIALKSCITATFYCCRGSGSHV